MPMRLLVRVPEADVLTQPALLTLLRAASSEATGDGGTREYVATLEDFPAMIDLAVKLVDEASRLDNVRITINDRPVADLTKFGSALLCYWDSLVHSDPQAYCAWNAARVGDAGVCPDRACVSHCRFLCTRCFQVAREEGMPPVAEQLRTIAVHAEVEWCPNLRLSVTGTRP